MLTLDLFAQIYLISFLVGGGFIIFNFLIGQIDHMASDHHGLHLLGGHDASAGHHTSVGHSASSTHQIGHSGGHSVSHDINHSGHGAHAPSGHSDAPDSRSQNGFGNFISAEIAQKLRRRLQILVQGEDISSRIGMLVLSLFSPMRIAIWLTFFGLSGFFIVRLLPWLSFLSLIPAFIIAVVCAQIFSNLVRWAMDAMQSPGSHNLTDLIGTIAEVNTPMTNNQTGEIVYMIDSTRANCAARPVTEGLEIKRGQRVMIVDMKEHIAIVEPVTDPIFLQDSAN
jgi:membrane protein implicated in regulation of membrane protease activity